MAEITAKLIQQLREKTSAGMMDCKKALTENNGDIETTADPVPKMTSSRSWLRMLPHARWN